MKYALPIAACVLGLLGRKLGKAQKQRWALRQHSSLCSTPCSSYKDLPDSVINHIISLADKDARLAMFRSCVQLRDAVLGCVTVSSSGQQFNTQLHISTDFTPCSQQTPCSKPQAASRLLQLAASSAHDVHLHIQSTFTPDVALLCVRYQSGQLVERSTFSNRMCGTVVSRAWIAAMFRPWLAGPRLATPLCHVTTIWLCDMVLEHPMPDYIGRACPSLTTYGLRNVVWDLLRDAYPRAWPQVEQLVLQDVCPCQLPKLFNPTTLPGLRSLHVAWSEAYGTTQQAAYADSAAQIGACCIGFKDQLTSLSLDGVSWYQVMGEHGLQQFHSLTSLRIPHEAHGNPWQGEELGYNTNMLHIVQATPSLEYLHVGAFAMSQRPTHAEYQWDKLRRLQFDSVDGDVMMALGCMPHMPELKLVTLFYGSTSIDVQVGSRWLTDVAKVVPPKRQGANWFMGHRWCIHVVARQVQRAWVVGRKAARFGRSVFSIARRVCNPQPALAVVPTVE